MKTVPIEECHFSFSRSSGKGGQNVNKVSTKVSLTWDPNASEAFSQEEKQRILSSAQVRNRLSAEGLIALQEQRERSQGRNRELAFEKLNQLVQAALKVKPKRVATKARKGSIEKRLARKKGHSVRKRDRSKRWCAEE